MVPPSLHALAWTAALHGLLPWPLRSSLLSGLAAGWAACWAVEVLAFLPLATWVALLGLDGLDPTLLEAARVARPEAAVLARVALPLAAPTLAAVADAGPELATSLVLAGAAAVAGPVLGWVVAGSLARGGALARLWWLAVGLPFALPAPLTGIGIALLGNVVPALGVGLLPALLASLSRVVPVVALLLYGGRLRTRSELLDVARVFQRDRIQGLLLVATAGLLLPHAALDWERRQRSGRTEAP